MKIIVDNSKRINQSLGNLKRTISKAEEEMKKKFRRSVIVNKDLKAGILLKKMTYLLKKELVFLLMK